MSDLRLVHACAAILAGVAFGLTLVDHLRPAIALLATVVVIQARSLELLRVAIRKEPAA